MASAGRDLGFGQGLVPRRPAGGCCNQSDKRSWWTGSAGEMVRSGQNLDLGYFKDLANKICWLSWICGMHKKNHGWLADFDLSKWDLTIFNYKNLEKSRTGLKIKTRTVLNMHLKCLLNIQVKIFNRSVGWKYKCESHQQESEHRQKWTEREGMCIWI